MSDDILERLRDTELNTASDLFHLRKDAIAEIERLRVALTGIAMMDVYTRPGEQQASEVMRDCAKAALDIHKRGGE